MVVFIQSFQQTQQQLLLNFPIYKHRQPSLHMFPVLRTQVMQHEMRFYKSNRTRACNAYNTASPALIRLCYRLSLRIIFPLCWTNSLVGHRLLKKKKKTAAIFRQIFLQNIFPSVDRWIRGQENFSLYSRLKKQPQAAR